MLQYVPAIGSTCLGVVVGFLVRFFIRRFDSFGATALGSVITIILGGAVIKFLETDKSVWWFYPIGLLVGFIAYQIIVMVIMKPKNGGGGGGGPTFPNFPSLPKDDPRGVA
jgi:hypothetical protein